MSQKMSGIENSMPVLCQEYMLFFGLSFSSQPRLLSTQEKHGGWGIRMFFLYAEQPEPWLTT